MSKVDRKSQIEAEIAKIENEIKQRDKDIQRIAEELQLLQSYNRYDESVIKLRREELTKYK